MDFLEFKINGNRNHYESKDFNRRKKLMDLVLAEVLVESGKYLDQIANGLWIIMEESTWTWPAHMGMQKAGVGLPDPSQFVIDLGAGESSAFVTWIRFLLGQKLSKVSPIFVKRIDYELNRRIVETYLNNDFKNWMGFENQKTNNWNIWINTNILMTSLLAVNDTKRYDLIHRSILSADKWLNGYGDDGGCDEGPNYWGLAGGKLIQFLFYLSKASGNQMNFSSNHLIQNIGHYIYRMHIDDQYFVNFADASAKQIPDPTMIFSYGQLFNDSVMKEFASYLYGLDGKESYLTKDSESGALHTFFQQMAIYSELKNIQPKAPQPLESWFPDLQVITLRSQEGSAKGLFLGAKAGTNDESHNHNDVGNFVLYINGLPAIIDVGVGTYTAQTFSKDRYKIWSMQSQWHNTPTINGIQQKAGPQYIAHNVSYKKSKTGGDFEADIAGAYPKEAEVKSWVRKLSFDRISNSVNLTETYRLTKFVEPSKIHFITILNAIKDQKTGDLVLSDKKTKLLMKFNSDLFDVKVEEHRTDDPKLSNVWGERVNRVTLISKLNHKLEANHSIVFKL